MRVRLAQVAAFLVPSQSWRSPLSGQRSALSSSRLPAPTESPVAPTELHVVPFNKPDRVIRDGLPVVYCYDHCPFCVRVRFALGLKNVKHTLHFLANDDIGTPTSLVGKKIAPILHWTEADVVMPESMEIVKLLDSDERLGPTQIILPATDRTDFNEWQSGTKDLLRILQRPRYVATGLLPEFQQLDGRHAYIMNHELPPFSKDQWKSMPRGEMIAAYAEAMAEDPAEHIEELNRKLVELDDIIFSEHHCSPGGVSYDDVDLFSRLRSVTIIKDVTWPKKLRKYMDGMAQLADIPLYDEMAL